MLYEGLMRNQSQNILVRQWNIIQIIHSTTFGKTARELSLELDCAIRTIYRDLVTIQSAGFPLYTNEGQPQRWLIHKIKLLKGGDIMASRSGKGSRGSTR